MKNKLIIGIIIVLFAILLAWLYSESTKPLPGEVTSQPGRDHKPEGSELNFEFNPPTGGDHYASWITKGFYDEPRFDGNLVHSLEHGYVIFWYNCDREIKNQDAKIKNVLGQLVRSVYAHDENEATPSASNASSQPSSTDSQGRVSMTGGSEGSPSAHFNNMPKSFSDGSCDEFKTQLKSIYEKMGPHKLIFVPRVGLEYPIVLTAWGRTLKLNGIEESKIQEFIKSYRDNGPEHTNEP